MDFLNELEEKMNKSIESLEKKFTTVRAGRATPNLVNEIKVNYYGVDTPIMQLANISVPEARQLHIKPYDKTCLKDIEKAIFEANIGLTPTNNGEIIIITIPPLTEERRKEYVKQIKAMSEEAKISLRNLRQDCIKNVKNMEFTDDEIKLYENDIQNIINKFNVIIDDKEKEKEKELMSI